MNSKHKSDIFTDGITVLSLCDGMSCGQIALQKLDIPIKKYFSFEVKKTAIDTTQLNFPNTIQLGDVNDFDIELFKDIEVDLFLCGSPCQNMSFANKHDKSGINGLKSSLFYKCVEIMNVVKPMYFLFENVKSMTNKDMATISELLGVKPIHINSALVSAQKRNRLYWTNIPNVEIPCDRHIMLADVLDAPPRCARRKVD